MKVPPRAVRLAMLPLTVGFVMLVAALLMVSLVAGLLAAPFGRRRRVLRVSAFGLAYCGMELAVLARGLAPLPTGNDDQLLRWALGVVLGAARRTFGFTVEIEGPGPASMEGEGPVLVLARHGGPGDSFSLAYLLEAIYGRRVRIVVKDLLQLDPAVDLLLTRRGCCFIASGQRARNSDRVAACSSGLGDREALLLFPEGENWTPRRRVRAIQRLRQRRRHRAANAAELMDNVLPPRPSGVAACLGARPGISVVVAAHSGLDRIVTFRQLWESIPFGSPMTVRFWPAQAPPGPQDGEEAVARWLTAEWAIVDEWIDRRRSLEGNL